MTRTKNTEKKHTAPTTDILTNYRFPSSYSSVSFCLLKQKENTTEDILTNSLSLSLSLPLLRLLLPACSAGRTNKKKKKKKTTTTTDILTTYRSPSSSSSSSSSCLFLTAEEEESEEDRGGHPYQTLSLSLPLSLSLFFSFLPLL